MSRRSRFVRLPHLAALLTLALVLPAGCTNQATPVATPTATPIEVAIASPTAEPTLEFVATPEPTEAATPAPTVAPTPSPTLAPTPTPTPWLPPWTPLPPTTAPKPPPSGNPGDPSPVPDPTGAGGTGVQVKTGNSVPTRIVVAGLHIDLPVIYGRPGYPVCNVAMYLSNFVNPGQPGSTYIYAHARTGMFLPLLNQSKINNGAAMIGMEVRVYTKDKKLHLYRIFKVKRHATDFSLATNLSRGEHRLIMQTSEGPHGTIPKLQVAAKPIGIFASTAAAALPTPHPKNCA
jgi:hypothetical protein